MSHLVNIHTHHLEESDAIQILSIDYQSLQKKADNSSSENHFLSSSVHPMEYEDFSQINFEVLLSTLPEKKVQAIGEIGLDKNSKLPLEDQIQLFEMLSQLSTEHQLPIVIHCVGKWNELELLFKKKPKNSQWIIHGFRKTKLGVKFLALGAKLSFGAALLYDEQLQEFVKSVPLTELFLETDDADIEILEVYEKLAELKCLPLQPIIDQLYSNYLAVFRHE